MLIFAYISLEKKNYTGEEKRKYKLRTLCLIIQRVERSRIKAGKIFSNKLRKNLTSRRVMKVRIVWEGSRRYRVDESDNDFRSLWLARFF